MRHFSARIAEECETEVQKRDQHEKWSEDKQRKWLMPRKYGECEEEAEYHAYTDGDAPVPKPLLVR
jgi:hypothetical protein